jgi:hypothetical protein
MNRFLAVVAVLSVAGCGSSGSPLFDGFVPTGGSALIFAPAVCDISFVGSTAVSGIALDFTSYADSCEVINTTQLCGNKANATRVLAVVLAGRVGQTTISPASAGTYSYLADPPTGEFLAAVGAAVKDDADCQPLDDSSSLEMTGGSITITSVTDTKVVGSTNLRFEGGQVFEHPFDLTVCAGTLDVCGRFGPCGNHTCVP